MTPVNRLLDRNLESTGGESALKNDKPYKTLAAYRLRHVDPSSPFYEKTLISRKGKQYWIVRPEDWTHRADTSWSYYFPPAMDLPDQGWKIHLSAIPGREKELLLVVARHLFSRGTPFKHLVSEDVFLESNSKYADRGSSGKFITVYPKDDSDFCALLDELEEITGPFGGPYVLSDTKYKTSPVYFRYGGFEYSFVSEGDGVASLAIHDKTGQAVKDSREAWFVVPDFVDVPEQIAKQVSSRLHPDKGELVKALYPFEIERSLHFSNGGGVYLAINVEDDSKVVLKEARRYVGYTSKSEDACTRLEHEKTVLQQLSDYSFVPKLIRYFSVEDHDFLAESFIEGVSLQSWIASEYPLSLEQNELDEYCGKANQIKNGIVSIVYSIHDAGLALMDISPRNFIVSYDLSVRLVDFEGLRELDSYDVGVLGTPGFMPLVACSNAERDVYGLVCLLMYLYLPSWTNSFSPETLYGRLDRIVELYPADVYDQLTKLFDIVPEKLLRPRSGYYQLKLDERPALDEAISALVSGMIAVRGVGEAQDRLYPGDATQYLYGELGVLDVETGASGIDLMLFRTGADVSADVRWILQRLRHLNSPTRFHGLLRGRVGIASAVAQMGFMDEALRLLPEDLPDPPESDISIRTGISGTALALLEIYRLSGSEKVLGLLGLASDALKRLIDENKPPQSPCSETGNAFGFFDGWCGAAVACRELSFALCREKNDWLDRMEQCLSRDLGEMSLCDDGGRYINYSGVNYCYLAEGAAGVLFALALCSPVRYKAAIEEIDKTLIYNLSLNGTLFRGMGGIIAALLAVHGSGDPRINTMMNEIVSSFLFRKHDEHNELYMLGDGGACLSADYSSGSAGLIGVLLSLGKRPMEWFPTQLHWPEISDH